MIQTTNSTCIFKEGDTVLICEWAEVYPTHKIIADHMCLDNWVKGAVPDRSKEHIVVREAAPGGAVVLALEDLETGQQYLVNINGVKYAAPRV